MIPGVIVSYAQNFEDVLLWRALRDIGAGFYIDIGAQDPVIDSVSRGFYEQGWRGIHVEPSPHYADLLRRDRPDEVVIQSAVTDNPGLLTFFEVPDTGMSTGIAELAEFAVTRGWSVRKTTVPAVTLDSILSLSDGRDVHWLKIDVEGLEREVLKGWRESSVRPWVVLLESITPWREHVHQKWEPLLLEKGYEFVYFDGLNRYYVLASRPDLKAHFGYGPSLWDPFRIPDNSKLLSETCQQNRQRVVSLTADLQAAMAERADLQIALGRSKEELAVVQEQATRSRDEADQLRDALATSDDSCARCQNSLADTETALVQARVDLDLAHAELNRTRSTVAELERNRIDGTALRASYDELLYDAKRLAAETTSLRRTLTQVQSVIEQKCSLQDGSGESQSVFRQDPVSFPPDVPNDEPLTSLESLLGYYDEAFVRKAYITLLRRHPDPGGLNHFLNKLRQGRSRLSIVEDIHASEEGRNVEPHIPGVDDAIGNVKRERSVRARLLRRLRRGNSSESEIDMLAGRTGEQLTSRGGAHDAAVARVTDLQATLQEISRILGHHSVPALAPPIPIARAEGDIMPVVQRMSPIRRATDRCIFLLVGLYGRLDTISFETRQLWQAWAAQSRVRVVVWDTVERKLRIVDDEALLSDRPCSYDNLDKDVCPKGSWLVAPQNLRPDHDTTNLVEVDAIMEANRLGLRTAFVFHGAEPLRRPEDAGPSASACDSYIQALLLADVVLPVTREAEDDLVALFTQHYFATWGPVIETMPWPATAAGIDGWSVYARVVDDLLLQVANPARRIKALYYWIDNASGPEQIMFALQLARTLSEQGVSLVPIEWNAATRSLTPALDTVGSGFIPWGNWREPAAADAPDWIVVATGVPVGLSEAADCISSRGLRIAILTASRSDEPLEPATLSRGQRAELQAMARADKVLALSEPHYQDICRFLLSWRGKVNSAEDRFKFLAAPDEVPDGTPRAMLKQTRPSKTKALVWAPKDRPDILARILNAAEQAARRTASRLSITVVREPGTDLTVDNEESLPSLEVSWCDAAEANRAVADANFAIHPGFLRAHEPDVIRCLWLGIPCVVSGSIGERPQLGTTHTDFRSEEAIAEVIAGVLRDETLFCPTDRWVTFAQELLTELATDRLRDSCKPLRKSEKDVYRSFPNLVRQRPRLSVCLSTYNRAGWVKRNLENIYSQISSEREDVEVFVVDNASPDNTRETVQPYLNNRNFRYHRNAKNVGMLGNLAVTAQRARGEYIWILGDDDLTRAGCINKVLDILHQHPGIGLVYMNYGYTSEPNPLSITDLPAFLDAYNVLEPAGPDELATVKDVAAKTENFYTAIYSQVYRRDHAMRSYCQNTSGRLFSTMLTCIPTSYYVLHYMPDESAYWIGEPSLVVNSNVSWVDYAPLFDLEQLPRAWDLAERNGTDGKAVDQRRANRLWMVVRMWKDLFENDRAGNSPYISAPRVLMRLKHLPEIEAWIPEMREIYTRAHRSGHPAASMPPEELFSAFSDVHMTDRCLASETPA